MVWRCLCNSICHKYRLFLWQACFSFLYVCMSQISCNFMWKYSVIHLFDWKITLYFCNARIRHASRRTAYQGGTFCLYRLMIYTNPPLSTTTLIANLKTDGLSVNDENFAEDFLNNWTRFTLATRWLMTSKSCWPSIPIQMSQPWDSLTTGKLNLCGNNIKLSPIAYYGT